MKLWLFRELLLFVLGLFLAGFALGWWVFA